MSSPPQEWISQVDQSLLDAIENGLPIDEILYGDHYVNINVKTLTQETPLHIAVRTNQISIFTALLNNHNTILNVQNAYGDTPLHIAIRLGHAEMAKRLLVDWRVNQFLVNKNKETILHLVISKKRFELYDLVKKEEVKKRDILGYSAFMYAIIGLHETDDSRYIRVIGNLLDHGAIVEIPEIMDDIGDIWKHFIHHPNFQLDAEIKEENTLFSYCCAKGDKELLNQLLSHPRMNFDQFEKNVFIAIKNRHFDLVRTLLTMDVEYNKTQLSNISKQLFFLNISDEDELSKILDILVLSKRITPVEIIRNSLVYLRLTLFKKFITLESIQTILIQNESIVVVCCIIYPDLFNDMIQRFVIGNEIIDSRGNNLLNLVMQQGLYSSQVIRTLLKNGCDPNLPNDTGHLALDYAIIYHKREAIQILMPCTILTAEKRLKLITENHNIPSYILTPLFQFNWFEMIKTMKIGTYRTILYYIMDSGLPHKREILFYMIGKQDGYQTYIELCKKLKHVSIEHSHNTIDIWTMEVMESENIIQYGEPIQGKYKTLTIESIIEMVRQTEEYVSLSYIKDPFDRTVLHEQTTYPTGYPVFIEVLIRKLLE